MASQYNTHPSPAPPGQQSNNYSNHQQQPQVHYQQAAAPLQQTHSNNQKPRPRSRGFSLQSDKSHKSDGKKEHLVESHTEKERHRLHSKADPTMAMNEAEPSAVAAQAQSNLQSLRGLQHKDPSGNVITDPDLSNPTRWREERPLDTIRAFEAAIDGSYKSSMINSGDNESVMTFNARNSYYGGGNNGRYTHDSYYGGSRPQSTFRPESSAPRDGYQDQYRWGPPERRRPTPRNLGPGPGPEQQYRNRQTGANMYGQGKNQRSYETVASGSGASGEPAGYQTDPTSSDNSSIERQQPRRQPDPVNDYGIGFSQTPEYQTSTLSVQSPGSAQHGYQNGGGPPSVPRKDGAVLSKPMTHESQQRPDTGDKRKSWFKRLSKGF